MADDTLSLGDRILLAISLLLVATGIGTFAAGVAMFWGPPRQVMCAPLVMALGAAAYVGARALWSTVRRPGVVSGGA
ncbi:hypothetical protein [Streptomyces sp. NPDC046859]|uniref:hypothetical protein n=1 Tax=Streptomyces sp. NPDC046859 TaxID=3155734 RepID=UPI0033E2014E